MTASYFMSVTKKKEGGQAFLSQLYLYHTRWEMYIIRLWQA